MFGILSDVCLDFLVNPRSVGDRVFHVIERESHEISFPHTTPIVPAPLAFPPYVVIGIHTRAGEP